MIKYYSLMLLLIGVCIAWGQGITEEITGQAAKDSAVVTTSDTSAVSPKKINDSAAIGALDTAKNSGTVLKDTSAVIIGADAFKSDSIARASNITVLDTEIAAIAQDIHVGQDTSEKKNTEQKIFGGRSGIGLNLMAKIFNSKDVNDFLEDVYDKWKDDAPGEIISETGFSPLISMVGFNVKGVIYIGPVVGIEPFGFVSFGNERFVVRKIDHEECISLVDLGSGLNIWARVTPKKCVSFKAGLGGYICHSSLNVDGYDGKVEFSGVGYGVNILAGMDITLRKLAINIDFCLPVGATSLEKDGAFDMTKSNRTLRYPKEYVHTGFVIRPGVTFQF